MNHTIVEIVPDGLGYGDPNSPISLPKQLSSGELTPEIAAEAKDIVASGRCLVAVAHHDSGCIDGRPASAIEYRDATNQLVEKWFISTEYDRRPLVAGGGYITARLAMVALHGPSDHSAADLARTIHALNKQGIFAGAHTGSQAKAERGVTDCGANDKFEAIVQTALAQAERIKAGINLIYDLLGRELAGGQLETRFDQAMRGYWQLTEASGYFKPTGQDNLAVIEQALTVGADGRPQAVIKHLSGKHKEDMILLNFVKQTTFDQASLLEQLHQRFPNGKLEELAQVFVIDIWHIVELAEALANTDQQRDVALIAMLAYQLATAATLTDGTLPVFAAFSPQTLPASLAQKQLQAV